MSASFFTPHQALAAQSVSAFTSLLFEHTIEGLYASPEYGGNRGRSGWQYPMPPGPRMRASLAVASGARALGLHPFPFPMAANSASGYNGQHACNNCGFCASFGCPVVARPSALIPLRHALRTGKVRLVPETMVTKVLLSTSGATGRATGVHWTRMTERGPVTGAETADVVVMAASAIETVRRSSSTSGCTPTGNSGGLPTGNHIMGGMMMGTDPGASVTDAYGQVHGLDNVYVADGSVFVTSGAHNPTNTIMAVALRNMRHLAGS